MCGALVAIVASATLTSCASSGGTGPGGTVEYRVQKHGDLAYGERRWLFDASRQLDIYQPKGAANAPVLLFVHGGAWLIGSKVFDAHVGKGFARHGYLTVTINYRVGLQAEHPEHIRDVARAFDWVKRNAAKYGGDPDRVFISGHSAGGHLVALLATNERYLAEVGRSTHEIAGVIPVGGLFRVGATSFIFSGFDSDEEAFLDASPEFHVDADQPPFLLVYAEHELPLLDAQAVGFKRELERHGSPVEIFKARGRNHVTIHTNLGRDDDPVTRTMLDFMFKYSPPSRYVGARTPAS